MKRSDFRFAERLRVRWAEVDMQKIVFNGHYMAYVDTAVGGYWRALALPYQPTMAALEGDLFVRKAVLEYHAPAEYDDLLDVAVRCERIGNSSLVFAAGVFRADELLVACELVYVFADPVARVARPVPMPLRDALNAFEAGHAMVDVRVGSWAELGQHAGALRSEVFVREQGIPAELEWDEADAGCVHAVAYNRLGVPLATGRLLAHVPGVGRIGRMAVCRSLRGSGVGRAVLDALVSAARQRGEVEVMLHSQASATAFYTRAGFSPRGPAFEEAGIEHIEMVRHLE